jgi:hypothetical protein
MNLPVTMIFTADEEDKGAPKPRTSQRTVYGECAEIRATYQKTRGFSSLKVTTQEKARELVDALLRQLVSRVKAVQCGRTAVFQQWSPLHNPCNCTVPPVSVTNGLACLTRLAQVCGCHCI